jgi:hypothetical protein
MFSDGTFQRYLYEIESTQKRLATLYEQAAGHASNASVRGRLDEFLVQLTKEQRMLERIRQLLPYG